MTESYSLVILDVSQETSKSKIPNKKYEIWIGSYHLGQGSEPSTEPQKVDNIEAPNFQVACTIHELRRTLQNIENRIAKGEYIDYQSCRWFYNFDTNSNSWTGKYYESYEEALKSFQ